MLGKLLKHEIRHSARYTMVIYIAIAAFTGVIGLAMLSDTTWLGIMACFGLYIAGMAGVVITLVSIIKNFYDTLYGRQGYLTFTLPVKCSTLLLSKVLVSFMWIIVSFVVMVLTYAVIYFYAKDKTDSILSNFGSIFTISGLSEYLPSGAVIAQLVIVLAVLALMTILTYVGYVYFTVTVANTRHFQAHPKFFGGLVFFGLFFTVTVISNKLTEVVPLTFNVTPDKVFFAFQDMFSVENVLLSYGIGGTVFSALVAVGLLAATGYIMEHKVNLK